MNKNIPAPIKTLVAVSAIGLGFTLHSGEADAHGYIKEPASRSYTGSLMKSSLGYYEALSQYGTVINAPQAVEGPKGFPEAGPADGQIASAGGGLGQIDKVMDAQSADMWVKQDIQTGMNTFTWNYTAPHNTSKWHYYITKSDWDPNDSLDRNDFEHIGTIEHDGSAASTHLSHQVNVPSDRSGYHVILGVWDVADTENAFYQVIDVNVTDETNNHNQNSTDNQEQPEDQDSSNEIVENPSITEPQAPTGLHTMGITEAAVDLMWAAPEEGPEITQYEIYRNNEKIATTDKTSYMDEGLSAGTNYTYSVKSVDKNKNTSPKSNELRVTTTGKEVEEDQPTTPTEEANTSSDLLEWNKNDIYVKGDQVQYNGQTYEAQWWTENKSPDLGYGWKLIGNTTIEWNKEAIYTAGRTVTYNGVTYSAKWWTQGDVPGKADVWEKSSK